MFVIPKPARHKAADGWDRRHLLVPVEALWYAMHYNRAIAKTCFTILAYGLPNKAAYVSVATASSCCISSNGGTLLKPHTAGLGWQHTICCTRWHMAVAAHSFASVLLQPTKQQHT